MAKKSRSGGTPATAALASRGVPFRLHPYEHVDGERGYGEEAARALNVDPRRIFKTLIVEAGGELAVAVVPVAASLDLKALAGALGAKKLNLADPAAAARSSGYVLGGISPIGQRTPLRTVIDASAAAFETVFVSGGRRGLQVELRPEDLLAATRASYAPIARSAASTAEWRASASPD